MRYYVELDPRLFFLRDVFLVRGFAAFEVRFEILFLADDVKGFP